MEFSYERAAIRGEPMPDGLDWLDARMHVALRYLYASVRSGQISVDAGKKEKNLLIKKYNEERENDAFNQKLVKRSVEIFKGLELYANEYQKNPSVETADALMQVVYRMVKPDYYLEDINNYS